MKTGWIWSRLPAFEVEEDNFMTVFAAAQDVVIEQDAAEDTNPNKNIKTPNKKIILKPLLTIN